MKKFEYKHHFGGHIWGGESDKNHEKDIMWLNHYGEEGWELVSTEKYTPGGTRWNWGGRAILYILKREKDE